MIFSSSTIFCVDLRLRSVALRMTIREEITMKEYSVYITTNNTGTLYIGVTSDLTHRMNQHKSKNLPGFTQKYGVDKLVYFETTPDPSAAIQREKQLKGWRRSKKIALIELMNPGWLDLFMDPSATLRMTQGEMG